MIQMSNVKQQKGAAVVALAIVVILLGSLLAVAFVSFTSAYDYGNSMDTKMNAISDNNRNIYASGTQRVQEIAQVPGMYTEDFAKIVKADIEGRYGKDGSSATMQFLQEHDIKIDPSLYKDITQEIKSFRDEFKNNQTTLIDVGRSYRYAVGSLWQGFWLRLAGFPKINLSDPKYNPITTDLTEQVFKAGKEKGPLQLR